MKVTGGWRALHNEEVHNLCSWERWEMHTKLKSENLKMRDHFGEQGLDWRITLK
jgi:hypothetical protein